VRFARRSDRPHYLARRYAALLVGRVLDVGCDEAVLRAYCRSGSYVGLDKTGAADVHQDLARDGRLPFAEQSFDTVVCWDVLEHLDEPHALFDELARVTRAHLLVSLPNTWNAARKQLRRGHGAIEHYGLPAEPPADRHRWFFNLSEAEAFLRSRAARAGFEVRELCALEKPRPWFVRAARRLLAPRPERYRDLYAHTLAAHLRRPTAGTDKGSR
jgi:SAM-dependent methyltransferase